ncbi:hypothetical protein, partial [Klebsiella pneumoniae]|uniref:hypothetical protein n=1 Tax=Klebsiella pneumoniae TaxID=573 RepID=UPI001C5F6829
GIQLREENLIHFLYSVLAITTNQVLHNTYSSSTCPARTSVRNLVAVNGGTNFVGNVDTTLARESSKGRKIESR